MLREDGVDPHEMIIIDDEPEVIGDSDDSRPETLIQISQHFRPSSRIQSQAVSQPAQPHGGVQHLAGSESVQGPNIVGISARQNNADNAGERRDHDNSNQPIASENQQQSSQGSSALGKRAREEDEGAQCTICLDPWSNSGEHRLCSLVCGHFFGKSCITTWLKKTKTWCVPLVYVYLCTYTCTCKYVYIYTNMLVCYMYMTASLCPWHCWMRQHHTCRRRDPHTHTHTYTHTTHTHTHN
jgi:hypothetical protein